MNVRRSLTRPKVLCIDDDSAVTQALRLRFDRYAIDVLTAEDATTGFWLAVNEQPDVIITDLRMANGGGDYLVECLQGRTDTCDTPVIALTGARDCDLKRWMLTIGVRHYLQKPFRFENVVDAVRCYIDLQALSGETQN